MPEIPPQTVTEEQYTDEYGNMVVKKVNVFTQIQSNVTSIFALHLLQLVK